MNVTKIIGVIFLAAYLIINGLATMSEITLSPMADKMAQLLGVGAGVLLLISIEKFKK